MIAHEIRNRTTKQFQALASISALHRWCLTGTPIQNSLNDLGALVSFLKVPVLEKAPTFRKLITNPATTESSDRFQNLWILLQTICLRRTREILKLPEPITERRRLPLTESEQSEYDGLLKQGRTDIDMAVSKRGKRSINSVYLQSFLRLRLFCNNGSTNMDLQPGPTGLPLDPDEALAYLQQREEGVCAYCSGMIYFINEAEADGGIFLPSCCHLVCHHCVPHHRARRQGCPSCASRKKSAPQTTLPLGSMDIDSMPYSDHSATHLYPSKLQALLSDIAQNPREKR